MLPIIWWRGWIDSMIGDVEEMDTRTAIIHMWISRNIMKSTDIWIPGEDDNCNTKRHNGRNPKCRVNSYLFSLRKKNPHSSYEALLSQNVLDGVSALWCSYLAIIGSSASLVHIWRAVAYSASQLKSLAGDQQPVKPIDSARQGEEDIEAGFWILRCDAGSLGRIPGERKG